MQEGRADDSRRLWRVRAMPMLGLAVFALPSCFTMAVWRQGVTREEVAGNMQNYLRVQGDVYVIGVRDDALASVVGWQPGLDAGHPWLVVTPREHAESIARVIDRTWFTLELGDSALEDGTRCWLVTSVGADYWKNPDEDRSLRTLPGVTPLRTMYGNRYELRAAVDVSAVAIPPPGGRVIEKGVQLSCVRVHPPPSFAARFFRTPPSLMLDVLLSPFELLTLPMWW